MMYELSGGSICSFMPKFLPSMMTGRSLPQAGLDRVGGDDEVVIVEDLRPKFIGLACDSVDWLAGYLLANRQPQTTHLAHGRTKLDTNARKDPLAYLRELLTRLPKMVKVGLDQALVNLDDIAERARRPSGDARTSFGGVFGVHGMRIPRTTSF